ncbi:MAG: metal ABC transporter permease [Planctomycetia bacterium]|nr:metal ABC transporter permease [Planctomycetia bacterium]
MFASFMINTWIAATIIAITAGILGFFVVLRRSAFAAHVLPMGTFPGAAAAELLGIQPLWGLLAFVAIGVLLLQQLQRLGRKDVAAGMVLVTLMASGALLLSMTNAYGPAVFSLLFGEVLGVSAADLLPVAIISTVVMAGVIALYRPLLLQSAFPELAISRGVSSGITDLLFLTLLGLVTAMALPVVGTLLVFSLLVAPAATAQTLSATPVRVLFLSVALAVGMMWSAIALSFLTNWPIGFFVGATGAALFSSARIFRFVRSRWQSENNDLSSATPKFIASADPA